MNEAEWCEVLTSFDFPVRWCIRCGETKTLNHFDGAGERCRPCVDFLQSKIDKARYEQDQKNASKRRVRRRKRRAMQNRESLAKALADPAYVETRRAQLREAQRAFRARKAAWAALHAQAIEYMAMTPRAGDWNRWEAHVEQMKAADPRRTREWQTSLRKAARAAKAEKDAKRA